MLAKIAKVVDGVFQGSNIDDEERNELFRKAFAKYQKAAMSGSTIGDLILAIRIIKGCMDKTIDGTSLALSSLNVLKYTYSYGAGKTIGNHGLTVVKLIILIALSLMLIVAKLVNTEYPGIYSAGIALAAVFAALSLLVYSIEASKDKRSAASWFLVNVVIILIPSLLELFNLNEHTLMLCFLVIAVIVLFVAAYIMRELKNYLSKNSSTPEDSIASRAADIIERKEKLLEFIRDKYDAETAEKVDESIRNDLSNFDIHKITRQVKIVKTA